MDGWKTSFLLGWPIFRCYVSFREGRCFQKTFLWYCRTLLLGQRASICNLHFHTCTTYFLPTSASTCMRSCPLGTIKQTSGMAFGLQKTKSHLMRSLLSWGMCRYDDGSVYKQGFLPAVPTSPKDAIMCQQFQVFNEPTANILTWAIGPSSALREPHHVHHYWYYSHPHSAFRITLIIRLFTTTSMYVGDWLY